MNVRVGWFCRATRGGSILIVVLWTVFFLGLLSVAVGAYVGARVETARRMSDRLQARHAARSGVERCLSVLGSETNTWDGFSEAWANAPSEFREIASGEGVYTVYDVSERADGSSVTNYGVRDEQARIDLNLLDASRIGLLTALWRTAGGLDREEAARLTEAIQVARALPVSGQADPIGEGTGWDQAGIPRGPFMAVEELLWVRGMTREMFEKVRDHLTVHGGTRININTAGAPVLRALFSQSAADAGEGDGVEKLVRKILNFRESGGNFTTPRNLAEAFEGTQEWSPDERVRLNGASRFVTVVSDHYRGRVRGLRRGRAASAQEIEFVWNRKLKRIEYWHED